MNLFRTLAEKLLSISGIYSLFQSLIRKPGDVEQFVSDWLQPRPGMRILDLGCGPGDLFPLLQPFGVVYCGVDFNPAYIATARTRYPEAKWEVADVSHPLPAPEHSFNLVVAKAILHHLDDAEAGQLLDTASRALTPGGVLVTVDPAVYPGQPLIARLLIKADRGRHVRTPEGYLNLFHQTNQWKILDTWLTHDRLRLPYSHFHLRGASLVNSEPDP